jgi:tetratricopeptide (TPR) repeat protein
VTQVLRFPGRVVAACALLCAVAGCGSGASDVAGGSSSGRSGKAVERREMGAGLFASAVDMLSRTDEFDEGSTDAAVAQMVRRLNESLDVLQPGASADPLTDEDGKVLRETVWLRDCARYAVGSETDAVRRGERLFDWVVRNIQQIPEETSADEAPPLLPWHILLFGRGKPLDQAWLFQLLARQQRLDVVILAYPDSKSDAAPRWWCVGLFDGGKLYLFDFRLGLPIAGPDGKGVATLEQVAADDKLLRAYDLPDKPYPVKTGDIGRMVALCETSSDYTAPRLARLETQLSGADRMQLTVDADKLRERIGKCAGIAEARAWAIRDLRFQASREKSAYEALKTRIVPFRLPERNMLVGGRYISPPLWKARVRHVSGKYVDPYLERTTINRLYQEARPADAELEKLAVGEALWEGLLRMKQHATYWLGLTAYDLKNYDAAVMYFEMVLKDKVNGGWTPGARYNLGRTYEAQGKPDKALETYRATYLGVAPDELCLQRARLLAKQ